MTEHEEKFTAYYRRIRNSEDDILNHRKMVDELREF